MFLVWKHNSLLFFVVLLLYTPGMSTLKSTSDEQFNENRSFSSSDDEALIQEGRTRYSLIVRDSKMPRYGSCWKEALSQLEKGCKQLTDDVQSRLALRFANCFLAKAGQATYPCGGERPIDECLSVMDVKGFTAYTNFFSDTRSMCQFLQTQVWHEETENTINRLSDNSMKVVQTLEDSNELQNSILSTQRQSLAQQEKLLESSSMLGQALDTSKSNVKEMLEEFRLSTSEQKNLIFDVFDRVVKLQNLVLGEVSGFYSLIFYPTALLMVYLLTSTTRTAAARFWLFILFGCSLVVERMVTYLTSSDDLGYLPADEACKEMFWKIWMIRKVAMLGCVALLCYYAYSFQDFNIINNAILVQIQRQNQEMKHYLESMKHDSGTRGIGNLKFLSADAIDSLDKAKSTNSDHSDSDFSYDSQASDRTYIPCKINDSSGDEETFETAPSRPSSNVTSPVDLSITALVHSKIQKEANNKKSSTKTPVTPSPYNLRSRTSLSVGPGRSLHTPVVLDESPEAFGRLVQKMERITKKNASKIIKSAQKRVQRSSYFSSDDE